MKQDIYIYPLFKIINYLSCLGYCLNIGSPFIWFFYLNEFAIFLQFYGPKIANSLLIVSYFTFQVKKSINNDPI